jgi:flavodoxin
MCESASAKKVRKERTMNTLIIYDSTFGNTAQIAQAMADKLGEHGTARIALANEAGLTEVQAIDLLLVGGPTQRHGLSPTIKTLLERFPRRTLRGIYAGAFDTRYHMSTWKSGSAAQGIASKLKRAGASLVVEPESFFVTEREGPLEEGELERAANWAEEIYQKIEAGRSIGKNNAAVR